MEVGAERWEKKKRLGIKALSVVSPGWGTGPK